MQIESEKVSSRIIGNVLMNWLAFGTTILAGFLMSPFLVRHLGDSVYGVWILIGSLAGYLGVLDFGVTPSIVKYVAEYRARRDQEAMNKVLSGALVIFTVAGCISLVISILVAASFNRIFDSPLTSRTAAAVVVLAGVNLAVTFPASVFVGVIRGYQRYDADSAITSVSIVLRSLVIVWLIMDGRGILALAALTFIFDIARLTCLIRIAYRLNPAIRIQRQYVERKELHRVFRFSLYAFLILVSRQMIFFTDSIVIGFFLSTSMVTFYFIASRLVLYLRMLVTEMVGVLMPTTSDLGARNDHQAIARLLTISTKYMLLIALPVGAVFLTLGRNFIALWMGPGYSQSFAVLVILTIAMLAHFLEMPAHTVLLGLSKHRVVALFTIIQGLLNIALSIVLVRRLGVVGVALGTMIPMIGTTGVALAVYFRMYLKLPLLGYLRGSCVSPVVVQAPFILSLLIIRACWPPATLVAFFVEIAIASLPYLAIAMIVCITRPERRAFLQAIGKFTLLLRPRYS
jgi:O-antigen/teichoic acid export membrane protein